MKGLEELKLMAELEGHDVAVKFMSNLHSEKVRNVSFHQHFRNGSDRMYKVWLTSSFDVERGRCIQYSFDWEHSPEAFEYWNEIRHKIKNYRG